MKSIKISEFKAKCIQVMKDVALTAEAVVVTHRGKPLVKVEPLPRTAKRTLGALRGAMEIRGDIIRSDLDEDWERDER